MKATIKRLVTDRGFGFLTLEDGKEVFFHRSALADPNQFADLDEDQQVEVEIETTAASPKGPRARTVKLVSASTPA